MNEEIQKQINKLTRTLANEQQITAGQVAGIIRGLATVLIDNKQKAEKLNAKTIREVDALYKLIEKEHAKLEKGVSDVAKAVKADVMTELSASLKEVRRAVIDIQESKPLDGKDADEEAIANRVMGMIVLPEVAEVVMDDGATIIRKINESEDTIEAIKVEGLADLKTQVQLIASMPSGVGKPFGGGASGIKDILAGTGVTITKNNGKYTISAPENGDVTGPASSTDNAIARYDGATGNTIQDSAVLIADTTGVISGTEGVTLSGTTSGTLALVATAVSGTNTVTFPAATGTVMLNLSEDTTPQLGGELDCGANSIGFTMQTATGDGTTTIDWGLGNHFDFTFGAFNETFTFTAPAKPGVYTLSLKQDSVGSRTATWPATVKWPAGTAPTLTTTATTGYDIIAFRYDGTNYYGTSTLNFS
jgi:hypothetical protein